MKNITQLLSIVILLSISHTVYGKIDPTILSKRKNNVQLSSVLMDCQPAEAHYVMEINNVRAHLLTGGDLWWDLERAGYIVPKPLPGQPEVSAISAAGLWIGGMDPNGALKLAGVRYRTGNATDFYSGPLDINGETDIDVCADWDRHFSVKGESINTHKTNYSQSIQNNVDYPCESIPDDVKYWPGKGNPHFEEKYNFSLPDQNMADFFDENGDGIYNPCEGDFPSIGRNGCDQLETPAELVFWTFNDNGGPHRLSQATPIQMEIRAYAFAYTSLDEVNDMTFYKFDLVNRASDDIRDCYFGLWVDADLGCSEDDYIGCDVDRSLAYIYNEDSVDGTQGANCPGGVNTYGDNIPIIGIDMFVGPRGPKVFCGIDADGNKILCDPEPGTGEQDTLVELGMTSFTYQNRGVSNPPEATKDPQIDFEFYNILKGKWKDGTEITFGNSGFDPASADAVKYVFSDPPSDETGWSMCTANLPFDDRRTVQSTGPLLLQPGAKNEMLFGVIHIPDADYPCPSIKRLQYVDDMAQTIFDNCFLHPVTPDAPDLIGLELDQELILLLKNDSLLIESNNAKEQFVDLDIWAPKDVDDPYYRFEGYKIYQLENSNVSISELDNLDKARLIRQVDIKNGITDIYNWFPIANPDPTGPTIWFPERQVAGKDKGIQHSFKITKDYFSSSNKPLQNGQKYYYTVLAYAHNNYMQYDVNENIGQRTSYIESKRNVKTYSFSPQTLVDFDIPTSYGEEAAVTRIDGKGTSFNNLDLEDGEMESILEGSFDGEITYKKGKGPINPMIVNPLGIKNGTYRLEITGDYNDAPNELKLEEGARWKLTDLNSGEIIASEQSIDGINEQIIHGRGFSIQVNQSGRPGDGYDVNNGGIAQECDYEDAESIDWWNAVPGYTGINTELTPDQSIHLYPFVNTDDDDDPENILSRIDKGHFIPFKSASWLSTEEPFITPGWKNNQGFAIIQDKLKLQHLNNVNIVLTQDKSKWSKCIVVESAVPDYLEHGLPTKGAKEQFDLRSDSSVDKNGNNIEGEGMGYFPRYALDVETGERLNIFFGENSAYNLDNDEIVSQTMGVDVNTGGIGSDMIWNPSTKILAGEFPSNSSLGMYKNFAGGQHYIYVTRQEYDGCEALYQQLVTEGFIDRINATSFITWTAIPIPKEPLNSIDEGLIPNELTIKLRVTGPYNKEIDAPDLKDPTIFTSVGGLPIYEFSFEDVEVLDVVSTSELKVLDDIVVSPNPFYEHSNQVQGQFDNVVRIANLPKTSVVTIYTLDGKFINRFSEELGSKFIESRDSEDLEWNLKDHNGLRVSGGVYIIHISLPTLGIQKSFKLIKV